jgi:hypothetical protein
LKVERISNARVTVATGVRTADPVEGTTVAQGKAVLVGKAHEANGDPAAAIQTDPVRRTAGAAPRSALLLRRLQSRSMSRLFRKRKGWSLWHGRSG